MQLSMFVAQLLLSAFVWAVTTALPSAKAATIEFAPVPSGKFVAPYPTSGMEGASAKPTPFEFGLQRNIRIEGEIVSGDLQKLEKLVSGFDRWHYTMISLDSPGGELSEALKLADLVHAWSIPTYVGKGDQCLSACGLIFLSGSGQVLRGISEPARTMHIDARVGLHAPFDTTQIKIPGGNAAALAAIADAYFRKSRAMIRDVQKRMGPWQISAETVFELLGRGPSEFYEFDRFSRIHRDRITLIADEVVYPQEIGFAEAVSVCDLVLTHNLGPSYKYGWGFAHFQGLERMFQGSFLRNASVRGVANVIKRKRSGIVFSPEAIVSGRGRFKCKISKGPRGRWFVKSAGDYPQVKDRDGYDPRIDRAAPFPITGIATLGPTLEWRPEITADLFVEDLDKLEEIISPEDKSVEGPSFDCNGKLDPAAKTICRFETLARLDGVMGQMYRRQIKADKAVKDTQRRWLDLREMACRSDAVDHKNEYATRMNGYCLLYLTIARINELRRRAK